MGCIGRSSGHERKTLEASRPVAPPPIRIRDKILILDRSPLTPATICVTVGRDSGIGRTARAREDHEPLMLRKKRAKRRKRLPEILVGSGFGGGWKADNQGRPCARSDRGVYEAAGTASIAGGRHSLPDDRTPHARGQLDGKGSAFIRARLQHGSRIGIGRRWR